LGSHDRRYLYRLEDGICWLLPALAIVRPEDANVPDLDPNRQIVQKFYDEFGWIRNNAGFYNDTSTFVDVRSTSQQYDSMCNSRIAKQLRGGTYLLDAASGAIPHESYIAFSKDYKFRVCLDFSIRALREAKRKLGDRGVYVLGDMTNLPIASDSIDDAVSLHTIYHVPAAEQAGAIAELVRVVRPGGRVVIVSLWDKSLLMDWVFRTRRALDIVKRTIVGSKQSVAAKPVNGEAPPLYGAPQTYRWFVENVRDPYHAELRLWSATSPGFHKMCFSDTAGGRLMAHLVLKIENALEPLAARFGQYPMFVISKT
jgi:ubiquinone/menaquinone biosynthesis C-methylase UbiE